jgi:hypothetical protein
MQKRFLDFGPQLFNKPAAPVATLVAPKKTSSSKLSSTSQTLFAQKKEPAPATRPHLPVHVSMNEGVLAARFIAACSLRYAKKGFELGQYEVGHKKGQTRLTKAKNNRLDGVHYEGKIADRKRKLLIELLTVLLTRSHITCGTCPITTEAENLERDLACVINKKEIFKYDPHMLEVHIHTTTTTKEGVLILVNDKIQKAFNLIIELYKNPKNIFNPNLRHTQAVDDQGQRLSLKK